MTAFDVQMFVFWCFFMLHRFLVVVLYFSVRLSTVKAFLIEWFLPNICDIRNVGHVYFHVLVRKFNLSFLDEKDYFNNV